MYVEDNPANLKLVEQLILRRPDLGLLTAINGRRGIELMCASQPDVILMDINLPDISGIEVLKFSAQTRPQRTFRWWPSAQMQCRATSSRGCRRDSSSISPSQSRVDEFMDTLDQALKFADRNLPVGTAPMITPDIHAARILIVDDQAANIRLLERMLTGAGYACPTSTMNPKEVCELHRKNRYDLILLDLHMPGMNGFQVMEGLQEIEQGWLPAGSGDYGAAGP